MMKMKALRITLLRIRAKTKTKTNPENKYSTLSINILKLVYNTDCKRDGLFKLISMIKPV